MFTKKFITAEIMERKKADKVFLKVFLKNRLISSFSKTSTSESSGDCFISTGCSLFFEIFEFLVQFIIIEYWNVIFKATKNGLTLRQWGICFLFSSSSLVVDFLLKIKI